MLGAYGEGGNNYNSRNRFKQVHGTCDNYRCRCVRVILDCLADDYYVWPEEAERL